MTEQSAAVPKHPPVTFAWIALAAAAGVIGFSFAFLPRPTHAVLSVLSEPTWVDRYTEMMTHPVVIVAEIILICAAFAKKLYGWSLVLFGGLQGWFLGALIHNLLTR